MHEKGHKNKTLSRRAGKKQKMNIIQNWLTMKNKKLLTLKKHQHQNKANKINPMVSPMI
jgi:hypothetical protein